MKSKIISSECLKELTQAFGRRLRARRIDAGFTQAALAEKLGMGQGDLCALEKGRHAPTLSTLVRLARSLNLPVSCLVDPDES